MSSNDAIPTTNTSKASASTTAEHEERADRPTEWTCIGPITNYTSRTHIKVHKRYITILPFHTRNTPSQAVYKAIDTTCYHAGGPLTDGSLKHIGNRVCLQCPWHSYLIDVDTGEGLYMDLDRRYRSKGSRQRVHEVEVRDEHLWVRLKAEGEIASDIYAFGLKFGEVKEVPEFPDW